MSTPVSVSVVVAAYNAAATLDVCLRSVAGSTRRPLECIVVDDGSTDESVAIATAAGVKVIQESVRRGPAYARNIGARAARGNVVVFLDSDVKMRPDTLDRLMRHLEEQPGLDAVFGSYDDTPHAPGLVSQYRNLLHAFTHQTARADASTFWCGCGAIRRARFLALGGLDPSYDRPAIEDLHLGYRLKAAGGRILLDRDAQVTHYKRWKLGSMWRTDTFDRALPWTRLILETRNAPNDLNLRISQRASVLAAVLLPVAGAAALLRFASALWMLPLLAILVGANWPFYRYLRGKRGWWFAAAAAPLHVAHHLCCAVGFGLGAGAHFLFRDSRQSSPVVEDAELIRTSTQP